MTRPDEPPGDVCQILCLTSNGQTPIKCAKQDPGLDDAKRIQRRVHHIRAVQGKRDKTKVPLINKMEAWLLPSGTFNQQRFSDALRKSRGSCDWQCCGSNKAAANNRSEDTAANTITVSTTLTQSQSRGDKNTATGKGQCLLNWNITESELIKFFTNVPSGNTWRSIGKFAENAPDWGRAKAALLQAKAERKKSPKERVSPLKSWTPRDTNRALVIYTSEQPASQDPSASFRVENSRALRTHKGPQVQEEANANAHGNLSERDSSAERATTPSFNHQDDSDADTSPAEAQSPSEWYAAAKRTDLAARQPKRQRVMSPRGSPSLNSEASIPNESIDNVKMGGPIPPDVIHATLKVLCGIAGEGVTVAKADDPSPFRSLDVPDESHRFIPLHYSDRWVLVVMSAGSKEIRAYEPQPSTENRKTVTSSILSRTNAVLETDIAFTAPMLQGKEGSRESGVLLVVTAFSLILRLKIPPRVDFNVWRYVIHAFLWSSSMHNDGSYPEPTGFGSKIHIGQCPESPTPRQLAEHINTIKLQASLALRRLELTSTSVLFVLKICERLEEYAIIEDEDQEDFAARLQRMRDLCLMIQTTVDSEERELKEATRNLCV